MPEARGHSRPLSQDMAQAARQIAAVLSGSDSATTLKTVSPAVSDLVYRGLRHWGLAQVRVARLAPQPPEPEILALLAVAWAALHDGLRAPHVVVSEAVAAAKTVSPPKAALKISGFVNALLRKTLTDPEAAEHDFADPVAKWNAPSWWIKKIAHDYPHDTAQWLEALCSRGSLTVRVSESAAPSLQAYIKLLQNNGLQGFEVGAQAVTIQPPVAVEKIPGFQDGGVSVQDSAAQQASTLFDGLFSAQQALSTPPLQLLDACAAPGGKSIALAQRYPATVWAVDISAGRLARLQKDLPRVGPSLRGSVRPVVGDVLDPLFWQAEHQNGMPALFDAILLDAPCSASGVVRRHPEIPWKRSPQAIAAVVQVQRQMLDRLWQRLKPGGELAYVTCSVFREEGEAQQQAFLQRHQDAQCCPSPGRLMPYAEPQLGRDQDGFFFAKFKKTSQRDNSIAGATSAVPDGGNARRSGQ